ncbi:MAG TPA: hypothetical protein ENJ01_06150 [Gammaproteobacteria bacterium]|nr:hypothetical protein [Gammaproteobacteria bacterium]
MSLADSINKGIAAHGMWKQRLIDAIATGSSEWSPATVCQDNQCEFGKWLYSGDAEVTASPRYEKVRTLHADFHKVAAEVLKMALAGQKDAAEAAIDMGSEYRNISSELTREMMNWKSEVS